MISHHYGLGKRDIVQNSRKIFYFILIGNHTFVFILCRNSWYKLTRYWKWFKFKFTNGNILWPKPYQNHTIKKYWFLVLFWSRTSFKFEPKTYQKTNQYLRTLCTTVYANIEAVFIDFWCVFGSNLKLIRLQNHTKNQYFLWFGFGSVLVRFWFGYTISIHI